jgi:hypothetical protein
MKNITKLAFLGAIIVSCGATVALADDAQLQNRLSLQRMQDVEAIRGSTVAVISNRPVASPAAQGEKPEFRFETVDNAHGEAVDEYDRTN